VSALAPGEFGLVDRIIGLQREEVDDVLVGRIPIRDHTRSPVGGLRTGVLLAAVDAVGGMRCGLACLPRWIVSTNLMVTVGRTDHTGPLRFEGRLLRIGRAAGVASVDVLDEGAGDRHVAHGLLTTAVLDPEQGPPPLVRPVALTPAPPERAPADLASAFAIAEGTGPVTTLAMRDDLRNRWGILHGGVVAVLADVAAERALGEGVATDTVLHYLRPTRTGPLEARTSVTGRRADGAVIVVSMHDVGSDDRQVALASVRVAL